MTWMTNGFVPLPRRAVAAMLAMCMLVMGMLAGARPVSAQPEGGSEPRPGTFRMSVVGEGKVMAVPDMAVVRLAVWTHGKTASEALQRNSARMAVVFRVLRERWRVGERDMQTAGLFVSPTYKRAKGERPRIVGYDVRNTLRVRVRNLGALGGLLDDLVRLGVNRVEGVRFAVSKRATLMNEARRKAVAAARARAKLYAEAAGLKLGRIIGLTEIGGMVSPSPRVMRRMAAEADASVPVARGEREIRAAVRITWEAWQK